MTPDEAAWVRANAWTGAMRKTFAEVPGFYTRCICQGDGPCMNSPDPGRHERCHVGVPLPQCETFICRKGGGVAGFREPYRHPSVSATGWHRGTSAMVWLADRTCRWACSCDCGHPRQGIAHAVPSPAAPPPPLRYEVVALPGLEVMR